MLGRLAARRLRPSRTPAAAVTAAAYHSSAAVRAHGGVASSSVLPDGLDRSSDAYARNADAVSRLLSDLRSRISQVLGGGGAGAVKRNTERGKLLPRERINRLLDPGTSFLELSQAAGVLAQIEKNNRKRQGVEWTKDEEEAFKAKVVEAYDKEGSPYYSTARLWDDGIIDPTDTRRVLSLCLSASAKPVPEDTKYGVFRM